VFNDVQVRVLFWALGSGLAFSIRMFTLSIQWKFE
jgi:hypothetical protein